MVHFTGLLENARHPPAGLWCWTLVLDPCKNWLPARIGGWPGTATGGQIHVVHISHTHPPKEIIQALRKYLLGKNLVPGTFCPKILPALRTIRDSHVRPSRLPPLENNGSRSLDSVRSGLSTTIFRYVPSFPIVLSV